VPTYKFGGSKTEGREVSRLILEGSSTNPTRYVDLGGSVELTDEEYERFKGSYKLRKTDDDGGEEQQQGSGAPETKADQQEAQVASGAMAPPASAETDNTPAGRAQRGK
jgi:hypothetical protein